MLNVVPSWRQRSRVSSPPARFPLVMPPVVGRVRRPGRQALARALSTAAGLSLLAAAGCRGDATAPPPSPSPIAGAYRVTRWVTDSGTTHASDYLTGGYALTLTVAANDSVRGQLTEPRSCGYPDGCHGPLGPSSVSGVAVRSGGTVQFRDIGYLSGLVFTANGASLRADQMVEFSYGDTRRLLVVLTRQ